MDVGSLTRSWSVLGRMIKCVNFAYPTAQPLSLFPLPPPTPSIFPSLLPNFCCSHAPPSLIKSQLRNWVEHHFPNQNIVWYLLCASSWNYSDQQSSRHRPCPDAYTWLLSVNLVYGCSQKYLDLSPISCKFNFMYQQLDAGNSLSDKRAFLLPLKSSPLSLLPSPYCLPSYTPRHILNACIETSQLQCFLICSGRKIELSVNFTILLIQWRNQ